MSFIGSISAQNTSDLNLTGEIDDVGDDNIIASGDVEILSDESCCEETSEPKTYYVSPDSENPNQVQAPTVQPVIDAANPGDTIVLNGTFVHCHFMINKTLTIIAAPGTSVGVCPHHTHMVKYGTGPEDNGIFYISPEARGTVLSGFSFTNDFYYIANNIYNPFGIYSDADDVVLENLIFNWIGVKQETSKFNPEDFLFNVIVLNNTQNTLIRNVVLGNVNSFITSINASNINSNNISIVESKVNELTTSDIVVHNLKILAGVSDKLQISLKDADNNPIFYKTVSIIIDGVIKNVTTDRSGVAFVSVKYASSGTHYVVVSFAGDNDYKSCIKTAKIIVSKKVTSLTASKYTLKLKKAKKLSFTLKSDGKYVSGKKITIKINGKTFSSKTNSKGVAKISVKVTKKGFFTYTVKFAGDNEYKSVSKRGKIVVKK